MPTTLSPFSNLHAIDESSMSSSRSQDGARRTRSKLFSEAYDEIEYLIEEIAPYDNADIVKLWQRKLILYQPITGVLVLAALCVYYGYRDRVPCLRSYP
ncbi:hypothetical protein DL95DRAFT_454470 [Leptodontidium sp. 2 PMI_412]|nr:hypothetical protein DL95DRAFT_454470 [Leptodontidium sp. 2 PMI_412]